MEWLLIPIVAAIIGGILASNKNRSVVGWTILCLLFPICILILLVLRPAGIQAPPAPPRDYFSSVPSAHLRRQVLVCPQCGERYNLLTSECSRCHVPLGESVPSEVTCPACKELIKAGALKCRHCGEVFDRPAGVALAEEEVS